MTEIQNRLRRRPSIQVDRVLRRAVAHENIEKTVIVPIRDRGAGVAPTRLARALNIHPVTGLNVNHPPTRQQGDSHFEGRSLVVSLVF